MVKNTQMIRRLVLSHLATDRAYDDRFETMIGVQVVLIDDALFKSFSSLMMLGLLQATISDPPPRGTDR
jgi:hypothetical protein